jgi:alpha-D-ribose 1-methylphosphonate 5-triphosphate synthase subunit PhnH
VTAPTLTPRAAREQETFRALLDAMARPGTVGHVPLHVAGGDMAAAVSVFEALIDHEVSFAAVPSMPGATEALLRLTGSRVAALSTADYVLCREDSLEEVLRQAKTGPLDYPDRGATIVCRVSEIGEGEAVTLSGPGIDGTTTLRLRSFAASARQEFSARNEDRPLGVDIVFVDSAGRIACLNRYTALKEA